MTGKLSCEYLHDTPDRSDMNLTIFTAWKVYSDFLWSVFRPNVGEYGPENGQCLL